MKQGSLPFDVIIISKAAEGWTMYIFAAEGLDSTAVLQVLEQPFEALPVTTLFFVRSFSPKDRLTYWKRSCASEQNLGC